MTYHVTHHVFQVYPNLTRVCVCTFAPHQDLIHFGLDALPGSEETEQVEGVKTAVITSLRLPEDRKHQDGLTRCCSSTSAAACWAHCRPLLLPRYPPHLR